MTNQKLSTLAYFFAFVAINPQLSTQQTIVNGTCNYKYDTETGIYSCVLSATLNNSTDILNIIGNHLESKSDSDVQKVTYSGYTVSCIHRQIMTKFPNIVILKVNAVGLKEIKSDAFETCTHLERYISSKSDLTTYPSQMMKNCQKLRSFIATNQKYHEIPEIFGNTTSLVELHLYHGNLVSLPENFIKNKPNLKYFYLNDNSLAELAPNFFQDCPNLKIISLERNNFTDQDKIISAFNGNTNLESLAIGSGFSTFNFQFFSQFDKLLELTVEGRSLSQISWQSLPSSLEVLNVGTIGEEIAENSFNNLVNLESLVLSGLGITNLHKDTFRSQTNLKMLSIYATSLKTLHPELFVSQSNLLDLSLTNNRIEELPAGIFAPLVSLGMSSTMFGLNLLNNKIKRLNSNSFGQHPELKNLDFSLNQIDEIERGLFSKFNRNLYRANFRLNVCVNQLYANNIFNSLNDEPTLQWCFDNYDGITTTTVSPTTPGAAGNNFKIFEILLIIFVGVLIKIC